MNARADVAHVWSMAFGDSMVFDYASSVSTDPSGNLFVAGAFQGTVDFGGGPLVGEGIWQDAFLAKFDAAGSHVWSRRFGGPRQDAAMAGLADPWGNVVMVARLWGIDDLGGGPIGNDRNINLVLAMFDADGNHVWSRSFGNPDPYQGIYAYAAAVDATGSTYISGEFDGTAYLGGDTLTSADGAMFLARYGHDGEHLWSIQIDGQDFQGGAWGIDIDELGNVFVSSMTRTALGLSRYDTTGAHVWTRWFQPSWFSYGAVPTADGRGNVYFTGMFAGSIDFGGGLLLSDDWGSAFVAKFDGDGAYLWNRAWSGYWGEDLATCACVDGSGNVIVAGAMEGAIDFGGGQLTSAGRRDVFLVKLTGDGSHLWSRRFGGPDHETPTDVHLDARGRLYMTGAFEGTADFGGAPLVSAGEADMFVARYDVVAINFFDVHAVADVVYLYSSFGTGLGVDAVDVYRAAGSDSLSLYRRVPQSGDSFHFEDRHFTPGNTYRYQIGAATEYGEFFSPVRTVTTERYTTTLFPNAPNPFNPLTTIRYELEQTGPVTLSIYDVRGRRITTLVDNVQRAGPHSIHWRGTNATGAEVGSGVYFCRLEWQGGVLSSRMVLLK